MFTMTRSIRTASRRGKVKDQTPLSGFTADGRAGLDQLSSRSPGEAELVAFRIGQHCGMLGVISGLVQHRCTQTDEPFELGREVVRVEVYMHAVLHRLGLGDRLEEHLRTRSEEHTSELQ